MSPNLNPISSVNTSTNTSTSTGGNTVTRQPTIPSNRWALVIGAQYVPEDHTIPQMIEEINRMLDVLDPPWGNLPHNGRTVEIQFDQWTDRDWDCDGFEDHRYTKLKVTWYPGERPAGFLRTVDERLMVLADGLDGVWPNWLDGAHWVRGISDPNRHNWTWEPVRQPCFTTA